FTVDLAHLAVHPRVMENTPRGVRDVTAPERITFRGGDPDHGQPRGDEAGAEQAVVVRGLVQVRTDLERENRPQVRRPRSRRTDLGDREVADPDHADVPVGPGLPGGP